MANRQVLRRRWRESGAQEGHEHTFRCYNLLGSVQNSVTLSPNYLGLLVQGGERSVRKPLSKLQGSIKFYCAQPLSCYPALELRSGSPEGGSHTTDADGLSAPYKHDRSRDAPRT